MKYRFVNALGALGYGSLLIQWLWTIVTLVLPLIITSDLLSRVFLPSEPTSQLPTTPTTATPGVFDIAVAIGAVIFALGACVFAIYLAPRGVGKTGQKLSHKGAAVVVSHLPHKTPLSLQKQKSLIERVTWFVKIVAALLPLGLLLIPVSNTLGLTQSMVQVIGVFCAVMTLCWFGAQYLLAKAFKLPNRIIW